MESKKEPLPEVTHDSLPKAVYRIGQDVEFIKQYLLNQFKVQLPSPDELLTIQQTAELLKLSIPSIYRLVSRKAIPVMKKSKRLYFSKQSIIEWVKSGRRRTINEISAEAEKHLINQKKG